MTTFRLNGFIAQGDRESILSPAYQLNPYLDSETFMQHARAGLFMLPHQILSGIGQFKSSGNEQGFLLLKGMPHDDKLAHTPETHQQALDRGSFLSEYCLSMIGACLGELYGFMQESDGTLFNNIRPSPQQHDLQSSASSSSFLELHTEIAFHEFRPDFVLLYCLRQDQHRMAKTGVASIRRALPLIKEEAREELRRANYSIAYDLSFGNRKGKQNDIKTIAILEGDTDDPYLTYDSDLITPLTPEAKDALRELDAALRSTMHEIRLEPGDLIVLDNRRTAHSRTHFRAYYDGHDRWLQRAFVRQDLDAVRRRLPGQVPIIRDII